MTEGTKGTWGTLVAQVREQFSWLPGVLVALATVVLAWVWWAVGFLPGPVPGAHPTNWPPRLPVLLTQFAAAVFGPVAASILVLAVLRRAGLALLSVLLGYGVALWFTLHPAQAYAGAAAADPTERKIMLVTAGLAAVLGLAIGAVALRGPQRLGFLGLLAAAPVAGFVATVLGAGQDGERWLLRLVLASLLVLIAWRRWTGVLLWPVFFAWYWVLLLAEDTLRYGTETLRHPGGHRAGVSTVTGAMHDFLTSAWSALLAGAWSLVWPALLIATLVVAGRAVLPVVLNGAGNLPAPPRRRARRDGEPAPEGD